jgi:hypothetical protein
LDHEFKEDESWGDPPTIPSSFDEIGDYKQCGSSKHQSYFEHQDGDTHNDVLIQCIFATHTTPSVQEYDNSIYYDACETEILDAPTSSQDILPKTTVERDPDFQRLRLLFGWISADTIQKTFEHTTQYARLPTGTTLKKLLGHPILQLTYIDKMKMMGVILCILMYQLFFDCSTAAVIFLGTSTKVTDAHGIKKDNQFVNTLENSIIQRGAPNCLLSDRGQAIISNNVEDILHLLSDRGQSIISNNVEDILHTFCIGNWQSEPLQQHQNPLERRYQTIKNSTIHILDCTGAP